MKILVCVKVIKGEINPFDESALECGLRLSDDVTVLSMGAEVTKSVLQPLTRLGARVTLISDPLFAGSDTLATSYILSSAIKQMEYDLILCGRQSVDGDTAQVGPMLSAMLGCSLITNALDVAVSENCVVANTRSGKERVTLPSLVSVERGYVLRFPSIFSKPSEVKVIDNSVINCDTSRCGLAGSPTRVLETFENERGRRHCKYIKMNELESVVKALASRPALEKNEVSKKERLQSVWAVGEDAAERARELADEVIVIEKTDGFSIAKKAIEEKPDVILWSADAFGRKNAPIAAATLNTGLCADCTELDVEENRLIMYRPARGGSVYAKIKCLTSPQMATVRTKKESSDIIISAGRGVAQGLDKIKDLAEALGATVYASRGLVDTGLMPYELQVGLTGNTVSPKIYIAVGISGAVHHTCAIEDSDVIIAINPDRDARIFEYADYGILEEF